MDEPGEVATYYKLDATKPAFQLGGNKCFAATDRRDPARRLVAVQTEAFRPPRGKILGGRPLTPVPHALMPVDQGGGRDPAGQPGWFMLCPAPPGPALSAAAVPWTEAEVISCLLLPAALALDAMADQDLTHRAIRPDNVFRAGRGERIVLGPCWAAPPASYQPAAFEPPYSAMCPPYARGDGSVADDVYALGATIIWCMLGGQVNWQDGAAVLARKLEVGSLEALAGGRSLSPSLMDLLRVMLAEDPEHRPSPSLLQDPTQARARRLAQRPAQRHSGPSILAAPPPGAPANWRWRSPGCRRRARPRSRTAPRTAGCGAISATARWRWRWMRPCSAATPNPRRTMRAARPCW